MNELGKELKKYSGEIDSFLTKSCTTGLLLLDEGLGILDCNLGFLRQFNLQHNPRGRKLLDFFEFNSSVLLHGEHLKLASSQKSGTHAVYPCYAIKIEGGFLFFSEKPALTESYALEQVSRMNTDLVNLQRELTKKNYLLEQLRNELADRVAELEEAMSRIKTLEGIIPICMHCKKIRNKQDAWKRLEEYITEHSEAQFSHGICPDCLDQIYKT